MKKMIALFTAMFLIMTFSLKSYVKAVEQFGISGLECCEKIIVESDSGNTFSYGISFDTIYIHNAESNILYSAKVRGKFRTNPCISSGYVFSVYQGDDYNYRLLCLNTENGSYESFEISSPDVTSYRYFSVSDNKLFLLIASSSYTYVGAFDFRGECVFEYHFERQNVNALFTNSGKTYAVLYDGSIYRLDKNSSVYCAKTYSNAVLENAGEGYVYDSNSTLYSLKENKTFDYFSGKTENISVCDDKVCYSVGNTAYLSNLNNSSVKHFNAENYIDAISINDNRVYIWTESFTKLVSIGYDEFLQYSFSGDVAGENYIQYSTEDDAEVNSAQYRISTDSIIYNIPSSLTVTQFRKNFSENIFLYDENGNEVTSGKLCTGYIVKIADKKYTIAVNGDITGEGNVNSRDILLLMQCITGEKEISGAYKKAADFNLDGCVDNKDLVLISRETS